jgi:hypothetical protein
MRILSVGPELFHVDRRTNGRMVRQTDRQTDGRTDGRTDRQRETEREKQTDGQTDKTKLIGAFRNFAKAPENLYVLKHTKM